MPRKERPNITKPGIPLTGKALEGYVASKAGDSLSDCPYKVGDNARVLWRSGWLDGNAEDDPTVAHIPTDISHGDAGQKRSVRSFSRVGK
jgi:ribosome modulation factor